MSYTTWLKNNNYLILIIIEKGVNDTVILDEILERVGDVNSTNLSKDSGEDAQINQPLMILFDGKLFC